MGCMHVFCKGGRLLVRGSRWNQMLLLHAKACQRYQDVPMLKARCNDGVIVAVDLQLFSLFERKPVALVLAK